MAGFRGCLNCGSVFCSNLSRVAPVRAHQSEDCIVFVMLPAPSASVPSVPVSRGTLHPLPTEFTTTDTIYVRSIYLRNLSNWRAGGAF
ncbi:hypothetical protein LY76DRAFT_360746 [Colletotrichum caudatum]|nr:hypothetical protein LY76DRAFT_360746 [Colletotrichum caudatum]